MKKISLTKNVWTAVQIFAATLIFAITGTAVAYAATATVSPNAQFFVFGMDTTEFTVKPFSGDVDPEWNRALLKSMAVWNGIHPEIQIKLDESSKNTIGFGNLERRALYSKICVPFSCNFRITINSDLRDKGVEWINGEGRFLMTHELGHALGLNDVIDTPGEVSSIMSAVRNYGIAYPHKLDRTLIIQRINLEKTTSKAEILATSFSGFLTPVTRAFNGYNE